MIKSRIYILSFTLSFLVSITGMPVYHHFCQMLQQKSSTACEMCESEMELSETDCNTEDAIDNTLIIKSEKSTCCTEEFLYNKVDDEFVFNKSNINNFSLSETIAQPIIITLNTIDFSAEGSYYTDSSPPFLINSDLHLTNSILLI